MIATARFFVAAFTLFLASTLAHAGIVPLSVYPNPVQFGTVVEFSTATYTVYLNNTTANSVVITAMSINGTNASAYALPSNSCITTIAANASCATNVTFTPSALGSINANLAITVQGDSSPINISLEGAGGAALPVITSLSPSTAYVNGAAFTLTVNGTGFVPGDVIYLNYYDGPLTTTYVSPTQLTAQVAASYLTYTATYYVYVYTPTAYSTNTSYLTVVNLAPQLDSVSPQGVVAASTPTALTLSGNSFMNGATVQWNGKTIPSTYTSSGQIQITPTKSELASAGIVTVTVTNPPPGGISQSVNFDVTFPATITTLDLPANDLVWDPYAQRIYVSLPSSYGTNGNTIAVINPANGKITGYYFAGSEPNQLALSPDSQYLYVGLDGNGSVQRLLLPNFTPDIDVSLGQGYYGPNTAGQILVSPSDDHTYAVSLGGCCTNGLYFYKDSTQLLNSITNVSVNDMAWPISSTLYAYDGYSTLSQVTVDSNGGTLGQQWSGYINGSMINYAAGLIYGNDGAVFNPSTGLRVGTYDLSGNNCCYNEPVLPESAINRVFALGQTPFFNNFSITSYNLSKFTPVAVTDLSQLQNSGEVAFIPWGSSGLAFILQNCCDNSAYQVAFVKSPAMLMTSGTTRNPAPVAKSLSPTSATHGGWNFPLTVTGTSFVPGSQVTWNGKTLNAAYVSATQLTVYVPYTDIASAGTAQVVVSNPAPGGGKSAALTFTIN